MTSTDKTEKIKREALETALGQIEKDHGKGAVMRLGEIYDSLTTESIPTGSLALDIALGIGGIPRGRVTEVFGAESAGKSTLAIHIMAETQKLGGIAAYIDVEHALDPTYAANCGLDLDQLLISQPDSAEEALDITEQLVRSGAVDTVIIDGEVVLRGGKHTKIDKEEIIRELTERYSRPLEPQTQEARALVQGLLPYVEKFYQDWRQDEGAPHYRYNSRG